MMSVLEVSKLRLPGKLRVVLQFLSAQGVTVFANLLYGVLCVRLLPPAAYAKFVVLFGIQGSLVILMDVGISGSLVPLVGEQIDNLVLIADYVASLRYLALRLYFIVAAGLLLCYPYIVRNRGWSALEIGCMVSILLLSTWFLRLGSAYGAVLILLRQRGTWYAGQMISSVGTLIVLLGLHVFGWLGAYGAILTNVGGIAFVGVFYFFRGRRLLSVSGEASSQKRKAILRLALPNIPGIIFYAFQGQVALLLITFFGKTSAVAGVGALSRLGQIFSLFTQMNPLLIEPYFAKLNARAVLSRYIPVLCLAGGFCLAVVMLAVAFPGLFLWVLGPNYRSLTSEVKWVVASGAVGYFTNVLWVIHSARKFIYWWSNAVNIGLTLLLQVWFVTSHDLSSVRSVVLLNFLIAGVALVTNALSGLYGFRYGAREVH